jgi:signal transduction histidine kinase
VRPSAGISKPLALGLAVVAAGLLASLWLQASSLLEIARTSPAAERASLEKRLGGLAADVEGAYEAWARGALAVAASAVIPASDVDDVEAAFRNAPAEGVRRYFVFSLSGVRRVDRLKVTLYNPKARAALESKGWRRGAAAARNAAVRWMHPLQFRLRVDPDRIETVRLSPTQSVIMRPIVDAESRIVGIAGMLVNPADYRSIFFPAAFAAAAEHSLSAGELEGLNIAVSDAAGHFVLATHPGEGAETEAAASIDTPGGAWTITAMRRGPPESVVWRRRMALGALQIALVAIMLVAGLALAFRASAREIRLLRTKADFLSNMTHELRSPLTSIRLYAELLESGRLRDASKIEQCGAHIGREARRLQQLVGNVLDFAAMDAGKRVFRFREADLVEITLEAVSVLAPRCEQAGVRVDVRAPEAPLPVVAADADALVQAITNLVDNAVKYSGSATEIAVGFRHVGERVELYVTDFGIGIPHGEQERIFERFYRVSTGLEHDVKGSGIGLAVVRHIVEAHAGTIRVASEPGRGSTFTVSLPALAGTGRELRILEAATRE